MFCEIGSGEEGGGERLFFLSLLNVQQDGKAGLQTNVHRQEVNVNLFVWTGEV